MTIEQLLTRVAEALEANTAALTGAKASTKTTTKSDEGDDEKKTTTKTTKKTAPKHDAEQVKAVAVKLMDALGKPVAKKLIKKHGSDALAELKPEVYDAFVAEAEEMMAEKDGGGDDDDNL